MENGKAKHFGNSSNSNNIPHPTFLNFEIPSVENGIPIATLVLSSRPKQGLARLWAKKEARESGRMLLRVQESVREWTLTLPRELPHWELESWWTFECSESDCRGQNSMDF